MAATAWLQLLVEELTGRPFADYMRAEVLEPLGMTASSFWWSRTAETARPHDAAGGRLPDFVFAEQAAAGLVTTAPDLARFLAAALAGPHGEPPGRGVLSPAGVRLALTAAPATEGRWGLGYGLGILPAVTGSPTTRAPTAVAAGLALLPDRRSRHRRGGQRRRRQPPDRRRGPAVVGPRHAEPATRTASHRDARHPGHRGRRRDRAGHATPHRGSLEIAGDLERVRDRDVVVVVSGELLMLTVWLGPAVAADATVPLRPAV